jgi:hypothetical protein
LVKAEELSAKARRETGNQYNEIDGFYNKMEENYGTAISKTDSSRGEYWTTAASRESARASRQQNTSQKNANNYDALSHDAKQTYEQLSRSYQIARRKISVEIFGIKILEATRPGGALNYKERMEWLGDRSFSDFKEVVARLHAIALGLQQFYSVDEAFITGLSDGLSSSLRPRIEGAVKWARCGCWRSTREQACRRFWARRSICSCGIAESTRLEKSNHATTSWCHHVNMLACNLSMP